MIYLILIGAIGLSGLLALVFLIVAIVQAVRTHWISALVWTFAMLLCLGVAAGSTVYIIANAPADAIAFAQKQAKEMQAAAEAKQKAVAPRAAILIEQTPEALRPTINSSFWYEEGFETPRRPLRFPYVMLSNDEFSEGTLAVNNSQGKVTHESEPELLTGITRYSFDPIMLICCRKEPGKIIWILYRFDGNPSQDFASEAELLQAAKESGFDGPLPMKSVKDQFDSYWK